MFVFFFLLAIQEPPPLTELEARVQLLEQRLIPDSSELNNLTQQTGNRFQQERNYLDRELLKLESRLTQLEMWPTNLSWIGVGSLVALIGILFKGYRFVTKQITASLKLNEDALRNIIRREQQDGELLHTCLLVLSQDGRPIKKLLQSQGFTNVIIKAVQDGLNPSPQKLGDASFELVIFDNLSASFINDYMAQSEKRAFVGFSPEHLDVVDRARINFANTPMTLFFQVQLTARYLRQLLLAQN